MPKEKQLSLFNSESKHASYNADMIIISVSLLIIGTFLNGAIAICQALCCLITSVLCEYIGFKLVTKTNPLKNLSAVACGLVISLFLPANAPLWLGCMACAFAVIVSKLPFGGDENAPFIPAVCGICFVSLCFPQFMFSYADRSMGTQFIFSSSEDFVSAQTLLDMLSVGTSFRLNLFGRSAILCGTLPGAIGATSMLALIGVFIYLLIRRPVNALTSICFVASCAAYTAIFPRIAAGAAASAVIEISAGTLVLTALLFAGNPSVSPSKPLHAIFYGLASGIICMLLRHFSKIDDPCCFSIMIMNAIFQIFSAKPKTAKAKDKIPQSYTEKSVERGGCKE